MKYPQKNDDSNLRIRHSDSLGNLYLIDIFIDPDDIDDCVYSSLDSVVDIDVLSVYKYVSKEGFKEVDESSLNDEEWDKVRNLAILKVAKIGKKFTQSYRNLDEINKESDHDTIEDFDGFHVED